MMPYIEYIIDEHQWQAGSHLQEPRSPDGGRHRIVRPLRTGTVNLDSAASVYVNVRGRTAAATDPTRAGGACMTDAAEPDGESPGQDRDPLESDLELARATHGR